MDRVIHPHGLATARPGRESCGERMPREMFLWNAFQQALMIEPAASQSADSANLNFFKAARGIRFCQRISFSVILSQAKDRERNERQD